MTLGIRFKLVALLAAFALLPLIAATVTIAIGTSRLRTRTIGENVQAVAVAEAISRRVSLAKDIEEMEAVLRGPSIVNDLRVPPKRLSDAELARLDKAWPTLRSDEKPMSTVLAHPIVKVLKGVMEDDPRVTGILITDRLGQLVADTGRTDAFYHADKEWWQKARNGGKGEVYIPPIYYDENSKAWVIAVCLPVMDEGRVIGIAREEIDVRPWVQTLSLPSDLAIDLMLVDQNGRVVFRPGVEFNSTTLAEWTPQIVREPSGWRTTKAGEIQGFAAVALPARVGSLSLSAPSWAIIMYTPERQAFGPVYRLSLITIVIGLAIIAVVFLLGLFLIDSSIVRRVLRLEQAASMVARGDLTQRVKPRWQPDRVLGPDEIDQLVKTFNQMVEHMQRSRDFLVEANRLKTNFIKIASHELRTPVSYIIGMTRLMKDSTDAARLLFAVQSMGSKAKRLEEIIEDMFKIMPDQRYAETLRYSTVSVPELLEEIYLEMAPFVEKRGQRLIVETKENLPDIQADREKLKDIVENVVMNAVQFTPDGGVVKVRIGRQLGDFISITVQDQGPGIPEGDLPHIFDPFYSGGEVMQHSTGVGGYRKQGMGLGLAIVRHFIEMHGGNIGVSTGPTGSIFTITIPVEPPLRAARPPEPELPPANPS